MTVGKKLKHQTLQSFWQFHIIIPQ